VLAFFCGIYLRSHFFSSTILPLGRTKENQFIFAPS